ncbi:MAG: trimethylamine methyltransferase family protein [Spirochaetota bacterium]|nr:MAG: trimethylamine methyltransferase family protein [Spirochaetota bacterium]
MRREQKYRKLTEKQAAQVHEYALQLIEEVGFKIECAEARDILGNAGCDVSNPDRIKIPRKLVNEALEAAPSKIDVYDRKGSLALVLKEWNSYYGTGSDCVTTIDLYSGQRKLCKKEDIEKLASFCDSLPNIDFTMSFGIAHDAPEGGNFVHQYDAMLRNTTKPIIVTGHGRNDMHTMIEMAASACGGIEALKEKPPLILYTEPLSPLIHTEMGVGKGLVCCDYNVPFIYIASPYMGATAPVSIEGTLVQTVAESLSGLVIFQKKCPGAKFIFGGDATTMDMRSTIFSYGAPEVNIFNACLADMAHFYKLPFFCIAGASDSKTLDAQAGLEYGLSIYESTLNGCNIIHDCGYLESGLTSSFESILFADEIIGMVKYMLRPLEFKKESVALDLIAKAGPGGNFIMEEHTATRFKDVLWLPRFLERNMYEKWEEEGKRTTRQILNESAKAIYENHKPMPLAEEAQKKIDAVIAQHKPDV